MATTTKTRPVASNVMTVLARVARSLGKEARKSLTETEGAHKAYTKATPDQQQAMRHVWVAEFMAAHLNIRNDEADLLRQAPRLGAKAKTVKIDGEEVTLEPRTQVQQQAYDRARKLFAFHISRDDNRLGAGKGKKVKARSEVQTALTALCNKVFEDGLTKDALLVIAEQAKLMASKMK